MGKLHLQKIAYKGGGAGSMVISTPKPCTEPRRARRGDIEQMRIL